ncbi:hypothetical protein FHX82_002292 [Amycolatopsis bartoniae]|uniref:Uncharacterized protein n=1 Tax=Amycolatopsis bartoniae TaxID=941986 RepID=A0A8H9J0G0_9PSEU|nr:hypothetical protein [Amycolatopsis bartoniae]MBB2935272.1 hypothetical protein [Amycolatopsis bartoniae]TVT06819.1 hypothetical protein FNH07_18825 [Amycolatopsis bartoniae]GHF55658.1 hypothetical protein GCM10017566_30860 [Amycolatopsis bartoniae]
MPLPSLGRRGNTRTDLKAVVPGRHRNSPTKEAEGAVEDHELTSYLAALAPETAGPESTGTGKRFGEAQVYQLRMNLVASSQLRDLAEERGTSPQALAREWVLERLSWEAQSASSQRRQFADHTGTANTDQHFFDKQPWA